VVGPALTTSADSGDAGVFTATHGGSDAVAVGVRNFRFQ
jgi:hypothetical protein